MKRFFIATAILMASLGAYAQPEAGSLTIQPKIGMNVSNYIGSRDSDPRIGLAAGAEFEYDITRRVGLSVGLMYSMQGAKSTIMTFLDLFNYPEYQGKVTYKTDYINIPVLANVYVYKGLALKVGIQPGFNVVSKYTISFGGVDRSSNLSDIGIDVKSFDFAIPFGISYEIKNVVIDARYNLGVIKIIDHDDSKNSVFQFTLGYKFGL